MMDIKEIRGSYLHRQFLGSFEWIMRIQYAVISFVFLFPMVFAGNASPLFIKTLSQDGRHYFQVPISILGKDLLFVSRITGHSNNFSAYGVGIEIADPLIFRLQRFEDKIWMRSVVTSEVTEGDFPIYNSVRANSMPSILYSFKIERFSSDSSQIVIDITDLFSSVLPWSTDVAIEKGRCEILSVKEFYTNIKVSQTQTFRTRHSGKVGSLITIEIAHSIVLLPENPMIPRFNHESVIWQTIEQTDYGADHFVPKMNRFLVRWRLQPDDSASYMKGKPVQPTKPIVFYLDPATPSKWRPYIRQGVEAWQDAFEDIGIREGILLRDAPSEGEAAGWDIDDFRNSSIRYNTGTTAAHASIIHDPRTGEILNVNIQFGHEHVQQLARRFIVQTAASNPGSRRLVLKDETVGSLIRAVISHEVGHALGLHHNMGASNSYSVDSLRSPLFTSSHGLSASIMDYAWGNYVAQPEDSVNNYHTKLGEYDKWAIWYGYKPVCGIRTPQDEMPTLAEWVRERAYYTGDGMRHDLGNAALYASSLGLNNLKVTVRNLKNWFGSTDIQQLRLLYKELIKQFEIYMDHVLEDEILWSGKRKVNHEDVISFFSVHLFETPWWLLDSGIVDEIGLRHFGGMELTRIQNEVLSKLIWHRLNKFSVSRSHKSNNPRSGYPIISDLSQSIFGNLKGQGRVDILKRNLQNSLIIHCAEALKSKETSEYGYDTFLGLKLDLHELKDYIQQELRSEKEPMSRFHLTSLIDQIDALLELRFGDIP